jgi:hypothetical protein
MSDDNTFLSKMEQRRARGEISGEEYALLKREWEAQEQVRERLQLIEEVAKQSVEQEDMQGKTDPSIPILGHARN